ncbi:MAG TPA: hypothetical protein VHT50_14830, partial [Mycobacterium sp.]|nr:hypothetical protein [Mycobacterium sp.]
ALPRVGHSETSAVGAVTSTGVTCSMQQGTALSIGVQLVNHAGHTVNLDEMITAWVQCRPGGWLLGTMRNQQSFGAASGRRPRR